VTHVAWQDADALDLPQLENLYAWPAHPTVRLNVVLDENARLAGADGTSRSLTNSLDRQILRLIRRDADAVIVGGESVRREGWYLPPHGELWVLSASGNLPWETCPEVSRVRVFSSAGELRAALRERPERVLCEGGETTARVVHSLVGFDEVAVSIHGKIALDRMPLSWGHPETFTAALMLWSAAHGMSFTLWRRAIPARPEDDL
jgi:hypothetical protein